jgi:hypothetical protein
MEEVVRSIFACRAAHPERRSIVLEAPNRRAVRLILALFVALVASVVIPSRLVTAQAPQAPPDRITLRSPDGRSEVVIALSDSGVLRITLAPTGTRRHAGLWNRLSLRLVGRRHPALELRNHRDELVAQLGGPRFRHTEP